MLKDQKWNDVEGVVDLNCEIFFLSSGSDKVMTFDDPGGRCEERDVKEIRIFGHLMSAKCAAMIAEELEHVIAVDELDEAHQSWINSEARRESRKPVAKGVSAK